MSEDENDVVRGVEIMRFKVPDAADPCVGDIGESRCARVPLGRLNSGRSGSSSIDKRPLAYMRCWT